MAALLHAKKGDVTLSSDQSLFDAPACSIERLEKEGATLPPGRKKVLASSAHRLRRRHRDLVRPLHRALGLCGVGLAGPGRVEDRRGRLEVRTVERGSDQLHQARIAGTVNCDSPWACPVCAPRIANRRAEALRPQIAAKLGEGWSAWLVTLTLRHHRGDDLAALFSGLSAIWGGVTSGRAWKAVADRGLEWVRGYDLTHGRHGWHPHLHLFVLLPPDAPDAEATARWIAARWRQVAERRGFETDGQAQHVMRCNDAERAARYATTPAGVYETIGAAKKTGRSEAGRTAFDILKGAVLDGQEADGRLWCSYVAAVKGRRQVTTSKGLDLAPDDELDQGEAEGAVDVVAEIGPLTMEALDRSERVDDLMDAMRLCGGPVGRRIEALRILAGCGAADWRLLDPQPLDTG